jgi:hypothetical protein
MASSGLIDDFYGNALHGGAVVRHSNGQHLQSLAVA